MREISTLINIQHENIVKVKEVAYGSSLEKIYVVMEYIDHEIKDILEYNTTRQQFTHANLKSLFYQLLNGVAFLHQNFIIHRDLKTSNLLYQNTGVLKICDFGLARSFSGFTDKIYTNLVVTLWYRAPELILGQVKYSKAVDIWCCGCIMAELILMDPLFMGKNEMD